MRSVIAVPWRVVFLLFLGMNEYTVLRVRFATDALKYFYIIGMEVSIK